MFSPQILRLFDNSDRAVVLLYHAAERGRPSNAVWGITE